MRQRPLRILLTNNTLGIPAGSEKYLYDIAVSLRDRGHKPIAYSTELGDVARDLRDACIPVTSNLEDVAEPPDLIHGHHHLDAMAALLHFPDVPAVLFCHGWRPWEETPILFPRILRYVAVDENCVDRLVYESGVPREKIVLLMSFVDLDRFKPRPPLPKAPQRALLLTHHLGPKDIKATRLACEACGLELDTLGGKFGAVCSRPEDVFDRYDIVFAKGRTAHEALAVGTAVVSCDSFGEMVTTENLSRMRALNFGLGTLCDPIGTRDPAKIENEIQRYDPADAARVSERIRAEAGKDAAVVRILHLYEEVLQEYRYNPVTKEVESEYRAMSRYLRWLKQSLRRTQSKRTRHPWWDRLKAKLCRLLCPPLD